MLKFFRKLAFLTRQTRRGVLMVIVDAVNCYYTDYEDGYIDGYVKPRSFDP